MIDENIELIGLPVHDALAKSTSILARPDHFSNHLLAVLETHEVSDSFEIQMTDGRSLPNSTTRYVIAMAISLVTCGYTKTSPASAKRRSNWCIWPNVTR